MLIQQLRQRKHLGKKWLYDNEPWEGQHVISHKGKPQFQNQLVQSSNNNMSKQTSKYLTKKFPWIVCVCARTRVCGADRRYKPPITRTYRRKSKKKTAQPVALWMEHTSYWA